MAEESLKLVIENVLNKTLDDDFYTFMHEEFYKLMFKYIPYDTGVLASTTDIFVDENNYISDEMSMSLGLSSGNINENGITFKAQYAEDTYYNTFGFRWHTDKHPNATSNWAKVALDSEGETLKSIIDEYLNRRFSNE